MGHSLSVRWLLPISMLFALIIVPFLLFGSQSDEWIASSMLNSASRHAFAATAVGLLVLDVLLPIPSSVVSTAAGSFLGFMGGAITCWVGMSASCAVGYWIGMTGGIRAVRRFVGEVELNKAVELARRLGTEAVVLARAVPVLAEASTIAAGAVRIPFPRFFLMTSLANLGIACVYAAFGAYAISTNSFLFALAGAIGVPAAGLLMRRALIAGRSRPTVESAFPATMLENRHNVAFSSNHNYQVHFTQASLDLANDTLARTVARFGPDKPHRIVAVADSNFAKRWPDLEERLYRYAAHHGSHLELAGSLVVVPGGESCKEDPALLDTLYETFRRYRIDRHAFIVVFGGGAVLDLVGYAAATTHRGIRLIRFPTTVLAQNDAGIGVKNGVNKFSIKNFVGSFQPPVAVINDSDFLETLDVRDRRAGLAEAVKVALIRDAAFFAELEAHAAELARFEPMPTRRMIERCAELHLRQIAGGGDPFETGSARPLDFGHWAAHKLESLTQFNLRHGEAVAIGIALDTHYSVLAGLLANGTDARVATLLETLGFRLYHPALRTKAPDGDPAILAGIGEFREHLGGELTITLLREVGTGAEVHRIDRAMVAAAVAWLEQRDAAR
jgi:3-dehydroquinate synthase